MEFGHPFTAIFSGPTGCGKTYLTRNLLTWDNFRHDETQEKIEFTERIWCYSEEGSINREPDVTYIQGLPSDDIIDGTPKLLVLDDLMHEVNDEIVKYFTKKCRHNNISAVSIRQNLFPNNAKAREMSSNAHYYAIFKNPRNVAQVLSFGSQAFPRNTEFFVDAYYQATEKAHGYLFCDFKQACPENQRLKTDIFSPCPLVFIP